MSMLKVPGHPVLFMYEGEARPAFVLKVHEPDPEEPGDPPVLDLAVLTGSDCAPISNFRNRAYDASKALETWRYLEEHERESQIPPTEPPPASP
jgi:hypothetical protein